MEFWIDGFYEREITIAQEMGLLHGVTTNPSIVANSGHNLKDAIEYLLTRQEGDIMVQVVSSNVEEMIDQAVTLSAHSSRIIVKVPATRNGFITMNALRDKGIRRAATTILEAKQVLLAAKAGAEYACVYFAHIEELGQNPAIEIELMLELLGRHEYKTKLLLAGLRTKEQAFFAMELGAHALTMKGSVFEDFVADGPDVLQLTKKFQTDWEMIFE